MIQRRGVHQVAIHPREDVFDILVDGEVVLSVEPEIEAHHWAKHVVECVNKGITHPEWLREVLPAVCERATILKAHTGYPAAS